VHCQSPGSKWKAGAPDATHNVMEHAHGAAPTAARLSEEEADLLAAQIRPAWEVGDAPVVDANMLASEHVIEVVAPYVSPPAAAGSTEQPKAANGRNARAPGGAFPGSSANVRDAAGQEAPSATGNRRTVSADDALRTTAANDSQFPDSGFPEVHFPGAGEFVGATNDALRYGVDRSHDQRTSRRASTGKRVLVGVFAFCGLIGIAAGARAVMPSASSSSNPGPAAAAEAKPKLATGGGAGDTAPASRPQIRDSVADTIPAADEVAAVVAGAATTSGTNARVAGAATAGPVHVAPLNAGVAALPGAVQAGNKAVLKPPVFVRPTPVAVAPPVKIATPAAKGGIDRNAPF
jgi:hypothetical protein